MILLKPWYSTFDLATKSFDKIPIWVRLPNFPLHYWFESCFEVVGNSLGRFLGVDAGSLGFLHTTYDRILVEMDMMKALPAGLSLKSANGSWLQLVDYEGIPFRCFQMRHMASNCAK